MAKSSDETKDSEQHDSTLDERRRAHPELGEEKEANREATDKIEKRAGKPTCRPSVWILSRCHQPPASQRHQFHSNADRRSHQGGLGKGAVASATPPRLFRSESAAGTIAHGMSTVERITSPCCKGTGDFAFVRRSVTSQVPMPVCVRTPEPSARRR